MTIQLGKLKVFTLEEIKEAFAQAGQALTLLTLRQYAKTGKLKARKIGNRWLVSEDALKEFFKPDNRQKRTA